VSSSRTGEGSSTSQTTGSIVDVVTDDGGLYGPAEGGRRETGAELSEVESSSRLPDIFEGNLTHSGFTKQKDNLADIVEGPRLTHKGFMEQNDDLDDINEGPRLTHPGFMQRRDDLESPMLPHMSFHQEDQLDDIDDGPRLTHPGFMERKDDFEDMHLEQNVGLESVHTERKLENMFNDLDDNNSESDLYPDLSELADGSIDVYDQQSYSLKL